SAPVYTWKRPAGCTGQIDPKSRSRRRVETQQSAERLPKGLVTTTLRRLRTRGFNPHLAIPLAKATVASCRARLVDGLSLPDHKFHLVLYPQLQLLQPHLFHLLRIGEIGFGGELIKLDSVAGMFFAETLVLLIRDHQLIPDGRGRSAHGRGTSLARIIAFRD